MRVKFLSGVGLGGGKFAEEGEVYSVADHFGRELVQDGRAMEYEGPEPEPAPDPEDEQPITVQTRDPKPKRIR
jgi:hypothetical protein